MTEHPPSETDSTTPEAGSPESSSEEKKVRDCFYCDKPGDGKPFKVWVHHKRERKEAFVNVARCRRCARRHEGWFYAVGVLVLLAMIAGFIKKRFEFDPLGEGLLSGAILGCLALCVVVHHYWPQIFPKLYGYSGEQHGHEDPMVIGFLKQGYELGPYPRDDDGNIIEQYANEPEGN